MEEKPEPKINIDVIIKIIVPIISVIWWISSLSMRVANLEDYHNKLDFIKKSDVDIINLRISQMEKEHERVTNELDSIKLYLRKTDK